MCSVTSISALVLLVLSSTFVVRARYNQGDFIQASWKAQFEETRTNWHDIVGHSCPRFGHNKLVALPLTKPETVSVHEYKIQFAFDGERFVTPWIAVLGKRAFDIPYVDLELRRRGDQLIAVHPKVSRMPPQYLQTHGRLVQDFQNATLWPKHLVVYYHFTAEQELNVNGMLFVLFVFGLGSAILLSLNAVRGHKGKLQEFIQDMMTEEQPTTSIAPQTTWKPVGAAKGD